MESNYITVLTIDIGEKNLALYKEKIDLYAVKSLKGENIPQNKRYNSNGECTAEFSTFLKKLSKAGERIYSIKLDITSDTDIKFKKRRVINTALLCRLTARLEELNEEKVFCGINYIIIEQQVKRATNNLILMHHIRSYFILLFLDFIPIILFKASYKTQILGAPKKVLNKAKSKMIKLSKYKRKTWASQKAFEILTDRNDMQGLAAIFSSGSGKIKSDDIADCILMNICFIYLTFVLEKTV